MEKEKFRKNFIWNTLGTGINAFTSFFYLLFVTRINGVNEAGIFTIAYSTACILYIIGIYAGRVFQVTESNKKITNKDFICNRIITCFIMLICVIGFVIFRKYDFYKSIIFILVTLIKILEAFADTLYAVMQKNGVLYKVGISYTLKGIISIVIFCIIDLITKNIIISVISVIVVWIIITIAYDLLNVRYYFKKEKTSIKNVGVIFKTGFLIFANTFLALYIINASKYAIDTYLTHDLQTIYGIIIMPATVMSIIAQVTIHPFLNKMKKLQEESKYIKLLKVTEIISVGIIGIGIIIAIIAYLLGIPVLNLLYNVELGDYRIALAIIIIAASLYNVAVLYSSVLILLRKNISQFIIHIIVTLFALVISDYFTKDKGIYGAVAAYCITIAMYYILYFILEKIILIRKNWRK